MNDASMVALVTVLHSLILSTTSDFIISSASVIVWRITQWHQNTQQPASLHNPMTDGRRFVVLIVHITLQHLSKMPADAITTPTSHCVTCGIVQSIEWLDVTGVEIKYKRNDDDDDYHDDAK